MAALENYKTYKDYLREECIGQVVHLGLQGVPVPQPNGQVGIAYSGERGTLLAVFDDGLLIMGAGDNGTKVWPDSKYTFIAPETKVQAPEPGFAQKLGI